MIFTLLVTGWVMCLALAHRGKSSSLGEECTDTITTLCRGPMCTGKLTKKKNCYQATVDNMRIAGQFVSRRYSEPTLTECADKCLRTNSKCLSFSYRRSSLEENEVSVDLNCELSSADLGQLSDIVLVTKPGYRVYSLTAQNSHCRQSRRINAPMESRDCFRRVLAGRRLTPDTARYSLRSSSLTRCQQSCIDAEFFCTAFSYKTDFNTNEVNCELSSEATWEHSLTADPMFDTHERQTTLDCGYFGAAGGADSGDFPSSSQTSGAGGGVETGAVAGGASQSSASSGTSSSATSQSECYQLTWPGRSIDLGHVMSRVSVTSLAQCQLACTRASFNCRLVSYRRRQYRADRNCEMSQVRHGVSTRNTAQFDTYTRLEAGGASACDSSSSAATSSTHNGHDIVRCFRLNAPDHRLQYELIIRNVMTSDVHNCAEECKITSACLSFSYRRDTNGGQLNCEMSFKSVRNVVNGASSLRRDRRYDTYSREYGSACTAPAVVTSTASTLPVSAASNGGCYQMVSDDKRLDSSVVDASFHVTSVSQCEFYCHQSSVACRSFSFSPMGVNSVGDSTNCDISRQDAHPSRLQQHHNYLTFQRDFSRTCRHPSSHHQHHHHHNSTGIGSAVDECFRPAATDRRISNTKTDSHVQAVDLLSCQRECRLINCASLSYKSFSFAGELNCRLSRDLLSSRDLIVHADHVTYIRRNTAQCVDNAPSIVTNNNQGGCYRHVGTGMRHQDRYIDGAMSVPNIVQCQSECSRLGDCRTLSFRSGGVSGGGLGPNCLLSRQALGGAGMVASLLLEMVTQAPLFWAVFQRDSITRFCRSPPPLSPLPPTLTGPSLPGLTVVGAVGPILGPLGPPAGQNGPTINSVATGIQPDISGCYRLQRRDQRLENHILNIVPVTQLSECQRACSLDRRCVSFNFRPDTVGSVCELSDMDSSVSYARFRTLPGWRFYEKDTSSFCSGWDNNYYMKNNFGFPYCSVRVQDGLMLNIHAIKRDINVASLSECEQACRGEQHFRCETFSFGLSSSGVDLSCQLTDLRISELTPRDTQPVPNFEVYDFHGNGANCGRPGDQFEYRHGGMSTCSGRVCVRGPCRIDRSGGFWYCFTDVSEASWDYCCDPDSVCLTEARMNMPTCYVTQQRGATRDANTDTAWRPCSSPPSQRFAYLSRVNGSRMVDEEESVSASSSSADKLASARFDQHSSTSTSSTRGTPPPLVANVTIN